jgi:hypothetical protein
MTVGASVMNTFLIPQLGSMISSVTRTRTLSGPIDHSLATGATAQSLLGRSYAFVATLIAENLQFCAWASVDHRAIADLAGVLGPDSQA